MTKTLNNTRSNIAAAVCDPNTMMLEQRIVSALADHTAEVSYLADLIGETERVISDATVIAERLEQIALDPVESPDAAQAKEAAEFAGFIVKRLNNLLPRLREAHHRVTATERSVRWNAAADRVQAKRDALASNFVELYPQIISGLLDLFKQVRDMDKEVDRVNGAAPNSEGRRVPPVAANSLIQLVFLNTKLVDLEGKQVWPPPQPQILPQDVMAVPSHPGRDWARANEQRDAARHAEAQRVANFYANQERQREEREAASARAAREAYRTGGGPTP